MSVLTAEMTRKLKSYSMASQKRPKGHKSRYKSYWNEELQTQWDLVCTAERAWLKCTGNKSDR